MLSKKEYHYLDMVMSDAGHTLRSPIFITRHFSRTSQIEGEVALLFVRACKVEFAYHGPNRKKASPLGKCLPLLLAPLSSLSFGRRLSYLSIDAIYAVSRGPYYLKGP